MEERKTDEGGTLVAKLLKVQARLNAPKSKSARNTNGSVRYNYRSAEDILEAVKPLLAEVGAVILLDDEIEQIGERYYVKATATILDENEKFSVSAYAREPLSRQGLDDAQLTGACSSYARKYALNGLLAIDDNKDPDDMYEDAPQASQKAPRQAKSAPSPKSYGPSVVDVVFAQDEISDAMTLENAKSFKIQAANGAWYEMGKLTPKSLSNIVSNPQRYSEAERKAAQMVLESFA